MGELADNVARVVDAGAVGINFEDGTNSPDHHARKIEVVRKTAQRLNVDLFINARIDVYLHEITTGHSAFIETVRRSKMYHQAGADGIFVPEVSDHELVGQLAAKIALPLNIIGRAGAPAAAQLQALGVRRLSSAAILYRVAYSSLNRRLRDFLNHGDTDALSKIVHGLPDFNKRFRGAP